MVWTVRLQGRILSRGFGFGGLIFKKVEELSRLLYPELHSLLHPSQTIAAVAGAHLTLTLTTTAAIESQSSKSKQVLRPIHILTQYCLTVQIQLEPCSIFLSESQCMIKEFPGNYYTLCVKSA